jgi:hypothetical protein
MTATVNSASTTGNTPRFNAFAEYERLIDKWSVREADRGFAGATPERFLDRV